MFHCNDDCVLPVRKPLRSYASSIPVSMPLGSIISTNGRLISEWIVADNYRQRSKV